MKDERVLVFPADVLKSLHMVDGLSRSEGYYTRAIFESEQLEFRPRSEVETDPSWKQIIPYSVFCYGDRLFRYYREGGGEKRLDKKASVGVGGHISEEDCAGIDRTQPGWPRLLFEAGRTRELLEEVHVAAQYVSEDKAVIYDPTTDVGKVHFGVVTVYHLDSPAVQPLESGLLDGRFVPINYIKRTLKEYERWSQMVVSQLF